MGFKELEMMPIQFIAERRIFKMDTADSTYVMQIDANGYLLHHYYGEKIADFDLAYLSYTCRHGSHFPRVEMESETNPFFSKDLHRMALCRNRTPRMYRS